jgi:hypothetical protein
MTIVEAATRSGTAQSVSPCNQMGWCGDDTAVSAYLALDEHSVLSAYFCRHYAHGFLALRTLHHTGQSTTSTAVLSRTAHHPLSMTLSPGSALAPWPCRQCHPQVTSPRATL